jgi:hypothetical protein
VTAFLVNDLRIDEDELGIRILFEGDVDDRYAAGDSDLGRGQSNPASGIHRLEHILGEFLQFLVEDCDLFGRLLEDRISELYDGIDHQ